MAYLNKQAFNVKTRAGFPAALSRENQRAWSERAWEHALKKGNFDLGRQHLNYEITVGGKIQPIDTTRSVPQRMAESLAERGIADPNETRKVKNQRTVVDLLFSGSQERMHKLAFGDQEVIYKGGNNTENLGVRYTPEFEQWTKDIYKFVCDHWGEENIISFYVHGDETTPHIHAAILPVKDNRIDYKGVFVGEVDDKIGLARYMSKLHDDLAAINEKYGLERGSNPTGERSKSMQTMDWRREMENRGREKELELAEMDNQLSEAQHNLKVAETKVKSFTTMVENKTKEKEQLEKRLKELTRQIKNSDSDKATLEEQIEEVKAKLETTNTELADKQIKLAQAEADKAVAEEELKITQETAEALRQETNKLATILRSQSGTMVKESMLDMVLSEFKRLRSELPPEQMAAFDGSYLEYLAERGNEMLRCSVLLFTGFVNDATTFAEGHGGGGGGSDLDWGREKDEDDRRWARRCVSMANRMMRPATRARKR